MNILLTGGAGYIGFALAKELVKLQAVNKVVIYDNLSRHNENILFGKIAGAEKLHLYKAELLDSRTLRKSLKDIDVVFHLAAKVITPFANQDPHFFEQINHWGTAELVYAVEESTVKKFVYVSSASVYGRGEQEATEQTEPNPQTYYGISKLRGEEHVRRLFHKTETQIIRCGNVYGYSDAMRFDAVINNFMLQANFKNRISIHGTGAQTRAFIHINEIASVLSQLATMNIPSGTYNCITKNLAVNDIAEVLLQLYPGCERIFVNQHLQLGGNRVSNRSKLSEYFSVQNKTLLEELNEFKELFAFQFTQE